MAGLPTFPPECRFSGYYLPLETQYCKYLKVLSDGSGITRKVLSPRSKILSTNSIRNFKETSDQAVTKVSIAFASVAIHFENPSKIFFTSIYHDLSIWEVSLRNFKIKDRCDLCMIFNRTSTFVPLFLLFLLLINTVWQKMWGSSAKFIQKLYFYTIELTFLEFALFYQILRIHTVLFLSLYLLYFLFLAGRSRHS